VTDLHNALQTLGEKPPFILVGASAGGLYVRLYQLENPAEVMGLVLIDPASEDRLFTLYQGRPVPIASLSAEQLQTTQPTAEVRIPSRPPQTGVPFDRLPKGLYESRVKLDQRLIAATPSTVPAAIVREAGEGERSALARLQASRSAADNPMANVPVVVLSRGLDSSEGLISTHAALARLSANSRATVVPNAGHEIHLFAPSAVIDAIRDVSTAVTQKARLSERP
jgi:pimeloyl-ACP methyl ester carboxylesterase